MGSRRREHDIREKVSRGKSKLTAEVLYGAESDAVT